MSDSMAAAFASLGLDDEAQLEYAEGIVQDDLTATDDKLEALLALIDPDACPEETARSTLLNILTDAEDRKSKQAPAAAVPAGLSRPDFKAAFRPPSPPPRSDSTMAVAGETEEERLRKERLLQQYGEVEDGFEADGAGLAKPGVTAKPAKKSASGPAAGDDLLFSNDNASKVRDAEVAKRQAAAAASASKREKDKKDLEKQRGDLQKRKEDARKKAIKGERRA